VLRGTQFSKPESVSKCRTQAKLRLGPLFPQSPFPVHGNAERRTALGTLDRKARFEIAVREGIRKTATPDFFSYDEPSCRGAGFVAQHHYGGSSVRGWVRFLVSEAARTKGFRDLGAHHRE